jgi:hypothetical protein
VTKFSHSILLIENTKQRSVACRSWSQINSQTKTLWELGKKGVKSHFDDQTKLLGIRDGVNRHFVFAMQQKGNQDQKDKINNFATKDEDRMFNSFLKLKGDWKFYFVY